MEAKTEQNIKEQFDGFKSAMEGATKMFDNVMQNLVPQSPPKEITIEVVKKKGFFGFGRISDKYKATVYISMNNIVCLDFKEKQEMKKYYENLK